MPDWDLSVAAVQQSSFCAGFFSVFFWRGGGRGKGEEREEAKKKRMMSFATVLPLNDFFLIPFIFISLKIFLFVCFHL